MSLTPLTCSWVHWRVASRLMHGRKNNNKASCKSRGVYTRVLVCSGCYNEIPQTEWLTKNRNLFLTVLEGGKFKIKVLADLVSGETRFLVHRWSLLVYPHMLVGGKGPLWGSFNKGTNPIHEAPSSRTDHLPKAYLLTLSHWWLGFNTQILGTQTLESVADS